MKIPSNNSEHFVVERSNNGYILFYEEDMFDSDEKRTASIVFDDTLDGKQDMINNIIDILGMSPHKRMDGIYCEVVKAKVDE